LELFVFMATAKRARTAKSKTEKAKPSQEAIAQPDQETTKVAAPAPELGDAIRERAYELYKQRGGEHGRDFEDWLLAEMEVLRRNGSKLA
jgi:hypothetical protein